MNNVSSRFETVARVLPKSGLPAPEFFSERLSDLYAASQKSNYVFGSPLGPFYHAGRSFHLPRFVYFGPQTHDTSLRLAFLTGFESDDLRASFALADFVDQLSRDPHLGQGLNLSFFPLIDVLGLAHEAAGRNLGSASWVRARSPELELLGKDARARGYHGFVQVETTEADDVVSIRLRNEAGEGLHAPGVELISPDDFAPFPLRWETVPVGAAVPDGPLTMVDNLPVRPFQLLIRLPESWSANAHRVAICSILQRFVLRQRAIQSYAQHL